MPHLCRQLLTAVVLFLFWTPPSHAQVGKAISRMESGKWPSAEQILRKEIAEDTLNVEARLWLSRFYYYPTNPQRNLDSARKHAVASEQILGSLSDRQRERLYKSGVDSAAVHVQRMKVDSAAFEDAKRANTVESYDIFMMKFPDAVGVEMAKEIRNEIAFVNALKLNTAEAFNAYLLNYPDSHRKEEARERYDRLVFEEITRDGKLASYRKFVALYPQSAYCSDAEKKIFEVSTASGLSEGYREFIKDYPLSPYNAKAQNILYYLLDEQERSSIRVDSLARLTDLKKGYWVPFFKNGKYGFMDEDGKEMMAPRFTNIDSTYRCGNIREDVLLTSEGLVSRSGHNLLGPESKSAQSLGFGFILVDGENCRTVVHKSGFRVGPDCVNDARIISNQFLAIRSDGYWKIYSLSGLVFKLQDYEDVGFEDKILIFTRLGKKQLVRARDLALVADGVPLSNSLVFDEVRAWGEGTLAVRNGALEGVVNQDLEFVIPLDRQTLTKTSWGFVRSKDGTRSVVGATSEIEARSFDSVVDYGAWTVLTSDKKSMLYRVSTKTVAGTNLDSVWMKNRIPFAKRSDSLFVFGASGKAAAFDSKALPAFIKSRDTVMYYWVQEKKLKNVFDANSNRKIFSLEFEDIESIGEGRFIVKQKNKKGQTKLGLIGDDGKPILQSEYDIIISSGNYVSLLKDKQFGLYHLGKRRLIKTAYERNVIPYSKTLFIAYKGGYGLINEKEESVTPFEFDEIRYWNDSSAWVRKNLTWSIYSIRENNARLTRIRNFEFLRDTDEEKIVRVQQDNHFGVISNVHGVIIPATFSDVINVGSPEKPFYFTDKRVEEAEIDVVIYYDHRGKLIRKEVYEADEYERIYCDD